MNITEKAINRLLNYYNLKTLNELADKLETTQSTISGWKTRNAIGALVDTVANKDSSVLEYIFRSKHIYNYQTDNIEIDENTLKLADTLYSFAKTNNKIDELKTDLSSLLPKYM